MTIRQDIKTAMQALIDLGIPITEVYNDMQPDFPQYIIKVNDEINISIHYSSYRSEYSFDLYQPIFMHLIDYRQQDDLLTKAGLVKPQIMHKPCKRRTNTNIAYYTKAYEILKKYYENRLIEREADIDEIKSAGGIRIDLREGNKYKFNYVAKSKLFTLIYNFEGFNYTSKKIEFNVYESKESNVELFRRFKHAGF